MTTISAGRENGDSPDRSLSTRRRWVLPDAWLATLFIAPTVLILALMVFYPFITLIRYSLLNFSMLRPDVAPVDVGLGNYLTLLTDKAIWQRFIFTGKFVLATLSIQFVVGIAAAYAFHHDFKGRDFLFTISLMPMMFCPIVVGFLWQYMFNSQWGLVNWLVSLVGVGKVDWLGVPTHALWAVAIADAWTWTPFVILLATAAFRGIPQDILESAAGRRGLAHLHLLSRHASHVLADHHDRVSVASHRRLQAIRPVRRDDRRRPRIGNGDRRV